jgi:protein-tyrosine phosphatase
MALGSLVLPLGKKMFVIVGGPFREAPNNYFRVKLAMEIKTKCEVSIPIRDFDVPSKSDLDEGLYKTVMALLRKEWVYAGCMGGKGRTGLFLAVLAKAFGVKNPVEYVRQNYFEHAVETKEQYEFVSDYRIPLKVRWVLLVARILNRK